MRTSLPPPSSHISGTESVILESLFCSRLLCHIQSGIPETKNLVLGAAPCPTPAVWDQWLHTARCPSGSTWKASGSPPTSTCTEHRNSGGLSPSPLFPYTPSPPPNSSCYLDIKLASTPPSNPIPKHQGMLRAE